MPWWRPVMPVLQTGELAGCFWRSGAHRRLSQFYPRYVDHGERAKLASGCFVLPDGALNWLEEGLYHRDGAPAVVHADGSTEWWSHGWLHREDGPAVVGPGCAPGVVGARATDLARW